MRRWRPPCPTRGTCTGTACAASDGSTRPSTSSRPPTRSHRAYFKAEKIPVEYDWHYQHNLDLLATSYQYIGQMAKAEALLKTSFAIPSPLLAQEFNKREWPVFLLARGRAARGARRRKVLAAHRSPVVSATGHVMAGHALLALGQFQASADEANAALRLMRTAPDGAAMVATPLQVLQGEFFLRTGQKDKGRPVLEEAAKKVRALAGARRLDAGALHARSHRAGGAGGRRLGLRRLGGASDAGARSELRGVAPRPRARRRTPGRCAHRRRRTGAGAEILEQAIADLPELKNQELEN